MHKHIKSLTSEDGRIIWPFPAGDSQGWPFPSVNGEQTPDSVALVTSKPDKPLTDYEKVMLDPETQEALI